MTGMPSLFASATAMCSFLGSMTNSASGSSLHVADAVEVLRQLLALALEPQPLLLGQRAVLVVQAAPRSPSGARSRCAMVTKLVSVPPSQRLVT